MTKRDAAASSSVCTTGCDSSFLLIRRAPPPLIHTWMVCSITFIARTDQQSVPQWNYILRINARLRFSLVTERLHPQFLCQGGRLAGLLLGTDAGDSAQVFPSWFNLKWASVPFSIEAHTVYGQCWSAFNVPKRSLLIPCIGFVITGVVPLGLVGQVSQLAAITCLWVAKGLECMFQGRRSHKFNVYCRIGASARPELHQRSRGRVLGLSLDAPVCFFIRRRFPVAVAMTVFPVGEVVS